MAFQAKLLMLSEIITFAYPFKQVHFSNFGGFSMVKNGLVLEKILYFSTFEGGGLSRHISGKFHLFNRSLTNGDGN